MWRFVRLSDRALFEPLPDRFGLSILVEVIQVQGKTETLAKLNDVFGFAAGVEFTLKSWTAFCSMQKVFPTLSAHRCQPFSAFSST